MQKWSPVLLLATLAGVLVARKVLAKPKGDYDPRQELPDSAFLMLRHTINRLRRVLRAEIVASTSEPPPARVAEDALPPDVPWPDVGSTGVMEVRVTDVYEDVAEYLWALRREPNPLPEVIAMDPVLQWDVATDRGPLPASTFFVDEDRIDRFDQALQAFTTAVQQALRDEYGFSWQLENAT